MAKQSGKRVGRWYQEINDELRDEFIRHKMAVIKILQRLPRKRKANRE